MQPSEGVAGRRSRTRLLLKVAEVSAGGTDILPIGAALAGDNLDRRVSRPEFGPKPVAEEVGCAICR
jgi:hypothetical protein